MKKFVSLVAILTLGLILMACTSTKYTVTFESNGGSVVAEVQVESGQKLTAPSAPTKSGYAFDGWFKEAALTTPWVFDTDTVTANITLYAKWSVTDQAYVDQVFDWLSLGTITGLTNQSPRIIFPTNRDGVGISWSIDKPAYIQANGLISQPTFEEGDQTVTLTATLTRGSVTRTKTFTATVLALPSIEETEPLINEDFKSYTNGNIIGQTGLWAPVSGKAGNSLFTVISSLTPSIPMGSNALKIEALTELQIEGSIAHSYDFLVFEVDLLQSNTSNASAINIQSSSSSPVVAFGLDGASLFYRTDNGTLIKTTININQWYTMRVEVDLVNKTVEAFYYESGQLVSLTPGKVSYTGTTPFQSVFIRSGSSTTTTLREPAYITNLVVNRIEALPRPVEVIKLGQVTDIRPTVSIEEGTAFNVDTPKVYNYFGTQLLTKDTDYTLVVNNPVNPSIPGDYVVTYTFTNSANASDIKVVTQQVNVYSAAEPNQITAVVSTQAGYLEKQSDITITVVQPSGTLYYLLSNNETETKTAIMAGVSSAISSQSILLDDLNVGTFTYIHLFVDLNGDSNIFSHAILREAVTEITSVSQFVSIFSTTAADITLSYALKTNIDLTGITWADGNTSFKGKFYGNGYTISNLTMTKTGTNYGGLFARINGGMVRDLVLDHIHVTSADRGGILVGRVENANSSITNIVIMNSSITASNANGVGGVIGLVSRETILSNVTILDSDVIAVGVKNVGGVVGRVDGAALIASDIYVRGVMVKSNVIDALDIAAGAFVGYVRDSVASVVTANRIVIIDTVVDAQVAGAFIGYNRFPGSTTAQNVYLDVDFVHPTAVAAGLIGRVNNETDKLNTSSIFGVLTGSVEHIQAQAFVNTSVPANLAWWTTNLPVFTTNALWTLDSNNIFALDNYIENSAPMMVLDLIYNITLDNEQLQVRQGDTFEHTVPHVGGYQFVGWFLDALLTQALPEGYVVSAAVTLYGKYETVPASEVTFVTNVEGLTVPMQAVNYGQLATQPVVVNQMIEGVLKEVVGWTLNGLPFDFSSPILENTELVAVWDVASLTVTFNGANPVEVVYGQLITTQPDLPTHFFIEVIAEWRLSGVAFDFNTPITADINLVSGFISPTLISIDTVEEFYYMATVESTYNYALSTDLDFTGYTWVYVNTAFKGVFDGQNHTIKNLTMTGLTNMGGIFPRANGATIKNLVLDNISIQTSERGGILVGRVENGDSIIQNIVIMNSSISGANANGVGGLIGLVSRRTDVSNISIIDTIVQNTAVNVGGLVGRVDSAALNASDIFIKGVTVRSTSANTSDVAASAFVGYVRDNVNSVLTANRVVVLDTVVDGNVTAAFVGYNRFPGTASISNAFFEVIFVNNERSGFIGYNRDQVVVIDQTSVYGNIVNNTHHSQALALLNSAIPTDLNWWVTNLNSITSSNLWSVYDEKSFGLTQYTDSLPELVTITLVYNISKPNDTTMLRVGDTFEYLPSVVDGYVFSGYYTNVEMTLELPNNLITGAITLYGKYEAVPPSQVSFVTNVDGLSVPTQDINYGQLAILPVVPNQTIEGVLSKVTGWTLFGQPYDFSTPVIADIDLVAVWEPVTYTVTFDGLNPLEVAHGALVAEPTEDPVNIFIERPFVEWRLAGIVYDFNTPVTANLNLVSHFGAPVGDIMITTIEQFYTMATVESTYSYKLSNNLDFAGYTWVYVNTAFKGSFDGQGFTISNLTQTGLTNYGGLFPRANGATIMNLVLDNVHISTTSRAGILVGRIENTATTIENIVIKNSSVYGADTNGVGGLVGHISKAASINNIAIIDSMITNNLVNVGGLVGRIDGSALVTADDIFIEGVTVKSNSVNTSDVAASALVGYIANVVDSKFSGVRIVVLNTIVDGNVTAAFVGYNRYPGTADLMDAYFGVTFVNNERSGLIGYNRDQVVVLDQTSIFGSITNNTPHSQTLQLTNTAIPTDAAWWTTNLNNIATSSLWVVHSDGSVSLGLLVD